MKMEHHVESEGPSSTRGVSSWISVCPGGLLEVTRRRTLQAGTGEFSPRMGSVCRVRVRPKTEDSSEAWDFPGVGEHGTMNEACADTQDLSYPRSQGSALQVPEGAWLLVRMGDGQCDVIESCLGGMRAGERCELLVAPFKDGTKPECAFTQRRESSIMDPGELDKQNSERQEHSQLSSDPLCFVVELHSFTSGQESWEMHPGEKWAWVKSHKKQGGERFRHGDVWGAADCYSRALKLLVTFKGEQKGQAEVDTDTEGEGEKDEDRIKVDKCKLKEEGRGASGGPEAAGGEKENRRQTEREGLGASLNPVADNKKAAIDSLDQEYVPSEDEYKATRSELHSNLSLCQLKLAQPAKAQLSSSKATELDPSSAKAWYRLGQACSQVGELACARVAFKKVLELQPGSPSAQKALREVKMREKELDSKLGQRLSKMFS